MMTRSNSIHLPIAKILLLMVVLAAILALTGCGDDPASPGTPPVPGNDFFSGPGAPDLPSTGFTVGSSHVDGVGNLVWVDPGALKLPGDMTIQVFPNPVDPTTATSVSLFHEGTVGMAWMHTDMGGVSGITIGADSVIFADITVSDAITGRGDVTINGTLARPSITLNPPTAPANVGVVAQDGNLEISWDAVPEADTYNLYVARESGITQFNYAGLAGGAMHTDIASPFTFPEGLTNGVQYFLVVTAANAAGESDDSAQASGTPQGAPADAGSLVLSGDAVALLPSDNFSPDTAGPAGTDVDEASYSWLDHNNTQGRIFLGVDAANPGTVFWVHFVQGDRTWEVGSFLGVSSVSRTGDTYTFTNTVLDEDGPGTTTLILDGSLNAIVTIGTPPSGSLTLTGAGLAELPAATFTPTTHRFQFGALYLNDPNGMELEISLSSVYTNATNRVTLRYNTTVVFQAQTTSNPVPGLALSGLSCDFTDVLLPRAFGSGEVVLNGNLGF